MNFGVEVEIALLYDHFLFGSSLDPVIELLPTRSLLSFFSFLFSLISASSSSLVFHYLDILISRLSIQHLIYLAYLNYNLLLDNMPDSDASEEFNEDVRFSLPVFMCHEMRVSSLQRAGLTFHIWFTGLYCRH